MLLWPWSFMTAIVIKLRHSICHLKLYAATYGTIVRGLNNVIALSNLKIVKNDHIFVKTSCLFLFSKGIQ